MGDRAQVHIKDENVWFYTHWGAHRLVEDVRAALAKKWRWGDPEYLARIIFDQMVGNDQGGETGFGISGRGKHGDERLVVEVDCENQKITVNDAFESDKTQFDGTFDDFIKT